MKFYIREKLVSLHNKYFIYDENDEQVYELESKYISIGAKTSLKDMDGNELVYVEQEVLHFMPQYNIYINEEFIGKVIKRFKLISNDYEVLELGYTVEGNFLGSSYVVKNSDDEIIANVSRKVVSIGDKYHLEILDEENYLRILGVLIAIINVTDVAQAS